MRFFNYKVDERGCWIWTGSIATSGYGCYYAGSGKNAYAHRLSYELNKGPIPEGLSICHTCDVKLCVNPHHLWAGTQAENVHDMIKKKRNRPPVKDFCKRGHKIQKNISCRQCMNMHGRNNYDPVKRHEKYLKSIGKEPIIKRRKNDVTD